jgi:selenocysteine-specific elongation factor
VRHLIVGTAGHIDHGKSSLVKRLTGIDPDRLKEEKARGITIELGFADLELGAERVASFVDVPGHERFVRHMVAGAAGIDAVMLVVAADEGVKPQTREHLEICQLLGVEQGLVAVTKADLVDPELLEVVLLELRELLAGSFLGRAPLLGVSSVSGQGIDGLRDAVAGLFERVPQRDASGMARLPVDRSFVMKGFGTVVTGSLVSGSLSEGEEVELQPHGARGRIRGLQVHRRAVGRAVAGQRTAVNLQGLSCDDAPRGATLTAPGALRSTRRVWASIELLEDAPDTLRRGGTLRLHQGTHERRARLRTVEPDAHGRLRAVVFLDRPAVLLPGDRFILRRPAPVNTVGGGVVLDAFPPRRRPTAEELDALQRAKPPERLTLRLERAGYAGVTGVDLAAELGLGRGELDALLGELAAARRAVRIGGLTLAASSWDEATRALTAALEAYHRAEPLRPGMSREELRNRLSATFPQEAWRVLLDRLAGAGALRLDGETVALPTHRVVLSRTDRDLSSRIEQAFRSAGLDPPELDDVVEAGERQRAAELTELLLAGGKLVKIRSGRLFHAEALADLVERLREYARTSETIGVGGFKELAGVTRRNAIPLLEHLDEQRLTRRVGNVREILKV